MCALLVAIGVILGPPRGRDYVGDVSPLRLQPRERRRRCPQNSAELCSKLIYTLSIYCTYCPRAGGHYSLGSPLTYVASRQVLSIELPVLRPVF